MTATTTGFGHTLKRLRLAAGLTQEALAERARVSLRAVSDLERDPRRTPRLDTVTLLADALEVPPAQRAELLAAARPPVGRRLRVAGRFPVRSPRSSAGPVWQRPLSSYSSATRCSCLP